MLTDYLLIEADKFLKIMIGENKMPTPLEVIRGISQVAANAYDGAYDEKGEPLKIGLKREEGHLVHDSRIIDGFKVSFHGDRLCVKYHSQVKIREMHNIKFEKDTVGTINGVANYLKREFKKLTGSPLTLTKDGEIDIFVQSASRVNSWIQAVQYYKIGNFGKSVDPLKAPSEDITRDITRKFLEIHSPRYKGSGKNRNVTNKQPPRPGLGEVDKG